MWKLKENTAEHMRSNTWHALIVNKLFQTVQPDTAPPLRVLVQSNVPNTVQSDGVVAGNPIDVFRRGSVLTTLFGVSH